jgi:hypothetical protein
MMALLAVEPNARMVGEPLGSRQVMVVLPLADTSCVSVMTWSASSVTPLSEYPLMVYLGVVKKWSERHDRRGRGGSVGRRDVE